MEKKRINEIKKGLENDIYTKIKDIKSEEKSGGKFDNVDPNYTSTDFLADILPKKKEPKEETVQIINKDSIDLEVDHNDILKKYDDYLHDGDSDETVKEENKKVTTENKKTTIDTNVIKEVIDDSDIPVQTNEQIKIIEDDLQDVDIKYKKQEEQEINNSLKKYNEQYSTQEIIDDLAAEQNIDVADAMSQYSDEKGQTKIYNSSIKRDVINANDIDEIHVELENDFKEDDSIKLPEIESIDDITAQTQDSQFIFEEDLEDSSEINNDNIGEGTFISDTQELDQDPGIIDEIYEDYDEDYNEKEFEEEGSFWDEDKNESKLRKYSDVALIVVIVFLIVVLLFLIT